MSVPGPSPQQSPLEAALAYLQAGYSVIPIRLDGTKAPDLPNWKPWQKQRPSPAMARSWWNRSDGPVPGVAVICGYVSGGLECIDFDQDRRDLFDAWCDLVETEEPGLANRQCIHRTPLGWHVLFKCPAITTPGSKKLALDTQAEGKGHTLIETKGEGGYVLVPGCPAACHLTKRLYEFHAGVPLTSLVPINERRREILIRCARSLTLEIKEDTTDAGQTEAIRAGDDYDKRGPNWSLILEPHGWSLAKRDGAVCYWRRSGKDGTGWSATTGVCRSRDGADMLRVFTSNAPPFEEGKSYGKFRAYALLIHNGDYSAAARALGLEGYGDIKLRVHQPESPPPPPAESEVTFGADADQAEKDAADEKAMSAATALVRLAMDSGATPFRDLRGNAWLRYKRGDRWDIAPLPSTQARDFLSHLVWETEKAAAFPQRLSGALDTLAMLGRRHGDVYELGLRVAAYGGRFYLALADEARHVVEMQPSGWKIVKDCPVRFRYTSHMLPLPMPVRGGRLGDLFTYVNAPRRHEQIMLTAWLVSAVWPGGEKAPLVITGPHGSGKSTSARIIARLIDPSAMDLRAEPKDPETFAIAAQQQWLLGFDNLSFLPGWLSDALCRLATGGTFSVRKHHTNDEEVAFAAIRPALLTSIKEVVTQADLLSRSVLLDVPALPNGTRVSRDEFWQDWERDRHDILGGLLDIVCYAMGNIPTGALPSAHRMTDLVRVGIAAGPKAGYSTEEFIEAMTFNEKAGHHLALEDRPLLEPLKQLVDQSPGGCWTGTATELLEALSQLATDDTRHQKKWPKGPSQLSGALRELLAPLASDGIEATRARVNGSDSRAVWTIRSVVR